MDDNDDDRDNFSRRRKVPTCSTASYTKQAIKKALAMIDVKNMIYDL